MFMVGGDGLDVKEKIVYPVTDSVRLAMISVKFGQLLPTTCDGILSLMNLMIGVMI